MLLKALKNGLGLIFVFVSWLTNPKPMKRSEADQAAAQAKAKDLALYQLYACPFCLKTRRAMRRLNVDIEKRDIKHLQNREALETQGGRVKVPCLRIGEGSDAQWLYESSDIIQYLDGLFSKQKSI
ncbi:MAG: glutathione S-transferase N-terminal domain-containing protein [Thalassolituus oleivorans]|nr:glutathione S-transferase N-terminal domain-containing protein [Thalassolituus oleivorans]